MKYIGAHVSAEGGVSNAPINALKIGAKAFALFTKNQKRWESPPIKSDEIELFKANLKLSGIMPEMVLPHDSYLINPGNPAPEMREKSVAAMTDELKRVEQLGLVFLNIHPGAHLGVVSEAECIGLVADSINKALSNTLSAKVIIETTAGQGSNVGYKFSHLGDIIERIDDKERVGVCIDTCHIFAAGYELRDYDGYMRTMDEFESEIGFKWLRGVHLNDSIGDYRSRKDRHNSIGKGVLGIEPFRFLMNDSRFDGIPMILETIDDTIWADEIKELYSLVRG